MNLNVVVVTGNLTADPELRALPSGTSVCRMRIAVNERTKVGEEWTERANFFDVTVWGAQGENCAKYLAKGRPVAIRGRLHWHEWETEEGRKRSAVQIVADNFGVQFLSSGDGKRDGGGQPSEADFQAAAASGGDGGFTADDDIPF